MTFISPANRSGGRRRVFFLAALLVGSLAILALWPSDELRFRSALLNKLSGIVFLALPLIALSLGLTVAIPWVRYVSAAFLGLAIVTLLVFLPVSMAFATGSERLQTIPSDSYDLALYRTNCGATCSYGLVLRQECEVFPGIVRRHVVQQWYPAYEATLSFVGRDTVRAVIPAYGNRAGTAHHEILALEAAPCGRNAR